jgi:hypothetical protein
MMRQPNESWGNTSSTAKESNITPHNAIAMAGLLVRQTSPISKMACTHSTSTTMSNDLRQQMLREMLPTPSPLLRRSHSKDFLSVPARKRASIEEACDRF